MKTTLMMSPWLSWLGLEIYIFLIESLPYKLGMWGSGHLGGSVGLIKDTVQLHYGNCSIHIFGRVTHSRD